MFSRHQFLSPVFLSPVVIALVLGTGVALPVARVNAADEVGTAAVAPRPAWAASATGRVEPRDGQVNIGTQMAGRVADVAVKVNDRVQLGDLLVRLEEDDLITRVTAAGMEVQVRERERDEEVVKGVALERRQADDAVATAERNLFRARLAFDESAYKLRTGTGATPSEVDKARAQIVTAREQLSTARAAFARVAAKDGVPLATRVESSLASSRADLSLAEAAVERARIRAPFDGSVLNVYAKFGELVAPSPDAALIAFGDLKSLRVKAEVEERDATKITVGQRVVVRGDAFPGRDFEGQVTSVAQAMSAPRIASRGVRRPNDIEVIEVTVALDGLPPLLTGMRVDVFFKGNGTVPGAPAKTN
jgi:HlyD family secretion protein